MADRGQVVASPSGGRVHVWRPRRARYGELVRWDTREHDWLEGGGEKLYLISMIHDAMSEWTAGFVRHDSSEETCGNCAVMDSGMGVRRRLQCQRKIETSASPQTGNSLLHEGSSTRLVGYQHRRALVAATGLLETTFATIRLLKTTLKS